MSPSLPPRLYRLLSASRAQPARVTVAVMVGIAVVITTLALLRVANRHEVVRLGYELTQETDRLHRLRETNRRLELERSTLVSPERIRSLATELGMVPVPPDQIRVVAPGQEAPK
jgi:cell division protein FtsL